MDAGGTAFIVLQFFHHGIMLSLDQSQILRLSHLKILQPVMPVHLVTQFGLQCLDGICGFLHQIAYTGAGTTVNSHFVKTATANTAGFRVTAEAQMLNQFVGFHIPSL
jgi:hypothetical protein